MGSFPNYIIYIYVCVCTVVFFSGRPVEVSQPNCSLLYQKTQVQDPISTGCPSKMRHCLWRSLRWQAQQLSNGFPCGVVSRLWPASVAKEGSNPFSLLPGLVPKCFRRENRKEHRTTSAEHLTDSNGLLLFVTYQPFLHTSWGEESPKAPKHITQLQVAGTHRYKAT